LNDPRTEASAGTDRDGMPDLDERAIFALPVTGLLKHAQASAAPSSSGSPKFFRSIARHHPRLARELRCRLGFSHEIPY
jgi:hypothetical protein